MSKKFILPKLFFNSKIQDKTIFQFFRRYFSYPLFATTLVVNKACGGSDVSSVKIVNDGSTSLSQTPTDITDSQAPILDTPQDDTFRINYDTLLGSSSALELDVSGGGIGSTGYDTLIVQGTSTDIGVNLDAGADNQGISGHWNIGAIKFNFQNGDLFGRVVLDKDNSGDLTAVDSIYLVAKSEADTEITGTIFDDTIFIKGSAVVYAGAGDDTINVSLYNSIAGNIEVHLGAGNDRIQVSGSSDYRENYNLQIYGGKGDDTIILEGGTCDIFYEIDDGNDKITATIGDILASTNRIFLVGFSSSDAEIKPVIGRLPNDFKLEFSSGKIDFTHNDSYGAEDYLADEIIFDANGNFMQDAGETVISESELYSILL